MRLPVPSTALTSDVLESTVEQACLTSSTRREGWKVRSLQKDDVRAILELCSVEAETRLDDMQDALGHHLHGVALLLEGGIVGVATFYFAYSTWDGRILYVDRIAGGDELMETTLLYTLADIATGLECQRLVWQHYDEKRKLYSTLNADTLDGWLTLRMGADSISDFLKDTGVDIVGESEKDLVMCIQGGVDKHNKLLRDSDLSLNHMTDPNNVEAIETLVKGLAVYEKEPESVHIGTEHYRTDGYQDNPWFQCILLKDLRTDKFCGIAFFYFGYDMKDGRFLYLEDLYIDKECRGRGGGKMIMSTLASIAQLLGCTAFVWQALDWNTPALTFYERIGAKIQKGLLTSRFAGKDLTSYAEGRPQGC